MLAAKAQDVDSILSQQNRERPGYIKDMIDSMLSQQKRDRPGYSKDVIDSTLSQQKRDRPGYSKGVIDSMLSQQKRESRLQQMTARQHDKLATELTEEREARLHQMSIHQSERLEEERKRQIGEGKESLMNQCSVQAKMRSFHAHFAALTSPRCSHVQKVSPDFSFVPHPLSVCVILDISVHPNCSLVPRPIPSFSMWHAEKREGLGGEITLVTLP